VPGPILGAAAVRSGAGAGATADPGGGVAFTSASNMQSLIDGNGFDTLFVTSTPGTYNNFRGLVYSAKHPRFYFVGAASGYSIHGGDLDGLGLNGTGGGANGGLEIHGGTWTHYGLPAGSVISVGPVNIGGGGGSSIIQDAVFTLNSQIGVQMFMNVADSGTIATALVSHCTFLSNGRYGLSGSGTAAAGRQYRPTIENCLIDDNNTRGFDPGDDASAQKFVYTNGGIWRSNWYKNNAGHACWLDGYNVAAMIADNVIEDNAGMMVFYEISRGGTIIEHNYGIRNGSTTDINYPFNGTGLTISNSPCDGTGPVLPGPDATSEIRYNDIDTSGYQSPIVLYNHSVHADPERTRKWYIHHNRMWIRGASGTSRTGLVDTCTPASAKEGDIGTSPGAPGACLFDFNEYHVADINGLYWKHETSNQAPGARTWDQFRAQGHETNGTRMAI